MKLALAEPGNAPTIAARIPRDVQRALTRRAADLRCQRSAVIREALTAYLRSSTASADFPD